MEELLEQSSKKDGHARSGSVPIFFAIDNPRS
jgi:hypothetical protein